MRNKKRWTAVLAAVLATAFMLQGTVYVGNEDMHNFVYPATNKGLENKTKQTREIHTTLIVQNLLSSKNFLSLRVAGI